MADRSTRNRHPRPPQTQATISRQIRYMFGCTGHDRYFQRSVMQRWIMDTVGPIMSPMWGAQEQELTIADAAQKK